MTEERILRLTKERHDALLRILCKACMPFFTFEDLEEIKHHNPGFSLDTFMGQKIGWQDLERAPRPEKEIHQIYKTLDFNRDATSVLEYAFPYLSEDKDGPD